jgi:hypothetical protein
MAGNLGHNDVTGTLERDCHAVKRSLEIGMKMSNLAGVTEEHGLFALEPLPSPDPTSQLTATCTGLQ